MKIAIPKEITEGEKRVAAVPEIIQRWVKEGIEVFVQEEAGKASYIEDEEYKNAGANIICKEEDLYSEADIILKVQAPTFNNKINKDEVDLFKRGAILVSFIQPLYNLELVKKLASNGINAFAMDLIPRITRAQSMDTLSSQAMIAGYKAVLFAANQLPRFFPMLMTAAMTIRPAKVLIIGAGVAGLQAIATSRRLGAVVKAIDTRPAVKEQVESLGASFVVLPVSHEEAEDERGYAKELPESFYKSEQEVISQHIGEADIVITTAQIPGRRAPLLITEDMVKLMKPGSVIVDLAIETGGNCTLSDKSKIIQKHGIIIYGFSNAPSSMPLQASQVYSRNIYEFLKEFIDKNTIRIDLNNEIIRETLITYNSEIINKRVKGALENHL